jgi:hypothetical protein
MLATTEELRADQRYCPCGFSALGRNATAP